MEKACSPVAPMQCFINKVNRPIQVMAFNTHKKGSLPSCLLSKEYLSYVTEWQQHTKGTIGDFPSKSTAEELQVTIQSTTQLLQFSTSVGLRYHEMTANLNRDKFENVFGITRQTSRVSNCTVPHHGKCTCMLKPCQTTKVGKLLSAGDQFPHVWNQIGPECGAQLMPLTTSLMGEIVGAQGQSLCPAFPDQTSRVVRRNEFAQKARTNRREDRASAPSNFILHEIAAHIYTPTGVTLFPTTSCTTQ